jgi:cytochrome c oxidase subunit III
VSDAMALHGQYADDAQRRESAELGMWIFLVTEIMFFGGLIATFTIFQHLYPEGFASASRHGDFWLGSLNTAVLLTSSLTMALAVHAAREGESRSLVRLLVATMILGSIFLGVKGIEYYHHFQEHLWPGPDFVYDPRLARQAEMFFYLYFAMTALHALHMIAGIGVLAVLTFFGHRGKFTTAYHTPVELAGLYWHFVDIIWIFLFPMLYLLGGHS